MKYEPALHGVLSDCTQIALMNAPAMYGICIASLAAKKREDKKLSWQKSQAASRIFWSNS